ncbi:hypothetical protein D3C81_721580 [compost metagenome]|jgi:hypothetical protein
MGKRCVWLRGVIGINDGSAGLFAGKPTPTNAPLAVSDLVIFLCGSGLAREEAGTDI